MQTKPHTIITASDASCGDFLVTHWLASLRENVVLDLVDVVVLDFGLTAGQRAALDGVRVVPVRGEGSVNVSRRAETARFLEKHDYDQVLAVDGGDLIFQRDLSHLFETHKDLLRGVPERYPIPLPILLRGTHGALRRSIREQLRGRSMVNGGFLLGPSEKMQDLGHAIRCQMADLRFDQPLVSCLLHQSGFLALDEIYNFVLWTARQSFQVEDGTFHTDGGERVAVVHNTGLMNPFRVVADFGYGPGHNQRIRTPYLRVASAWSRFRSLVGGPQH
jgi:hypothetical protein